jgi:hypothetical protein
MGLDVSPPVSEAELAVLRAALGLTGLDRHSQERQGAAWWRAGTLEAVGCEPSDRPEAYALSPRSTRGATRA